MSATGDLFAIGADPATVQARVDPPWDGEAWRAQARHAWCAGVAPDRLAWDGDMQGLLTAAVPLASLAPQRPPPQVDAAFPALAAAVACHADPQRFALLYRLLWRMASGEPRLLVRASDPDVHRVRLLERGVRRDSHKAKAFVRFREVPGRAEHYIAWFEPTHRILDRIAPFFARRFAGMHWAILTPYRSVAWEGGRLCFGAGATRADAPAADAQEALWRAYYAHIFNPARSNPAMMRSEMPQKYWKGLPEAALLPTLLREAGPRVRAMAERVPEPPRRRIPAPAAEAPATPQGLDALREAALACRRCPLWQPATRTVFGEGPADARVVVVGEQPGDVEDLSGRPFVGPAGQLLDRALAELGIARDRLWLTNAVKHFHFAPRGKRRLHRNPDAGHVRACRPWLQQELAALRPEVVVCLGATAAHAVLGGGFRLMAGRGRWHALADARALATVHPAWVLRQRDAGAREAAYAGFVDDLRLLCEAMPS